MNRRVYKALRKQAAGEEFWTPDRVARWSAAGGSGLLMATIAKLMGASTGASLGLGALAAGGVGLGWDPIKKAFTTQNGAGATGNNSGSKTTGNGDEQQSAGLLKRYTGNIRNAWNTLKDMGSRLHSSNGDAKQPGAKNDLEKWKTDMLTWIKNSKMSSNDQQVAIDAINGVSDDTYRQNAIDIILNNTDIMESWKQSAATTLRNGWQRLRNKSSRQFRPFIQALRNWGKLEEQRRWYPDSKNRGNNPPADLTDDYSIGWAERTANNPKASAKDREKAEAILYRQATQDQQRALNYNYRPITPPEYGQPINQTAEQLWQKVNDGSLTPEQQEAIAERLARQNW